MLAPPGIPITLKLSNGSDCRSGTQLRAVVEQTRQELYSPNGRWTPRNGKTYCNIYVWDLTRALACEIPHYFYNAEQTANEMIDWLARHGPDHGWGIVGQRGARLRAYDGYPTVATWENPHGHGHMAIVMPTRESEIIISQAGGVNFIDGTLARGFGKQQPVFYSHG